MAAVLAGRLTGPLVQQVQPETAPKAVRVVVEAVAKIPVQVAQEAQAEPLVAAGAEAVVALM